MRREPPDDLEHAAVAWAAVLCVRRASLAVHMQIQGDLSYAKKLLDLVLTEGMITLNIMLNFLFKQLEEAEEGSQLLY